MATLNRVGGIIMLISLLILPVLLIFIGPFIIIQWMHGWASRNRIPRGWFVGWGYGWSFLDLQIMNLVQLAFFIPLMVFSILCIQKDPEKARLYGILSIIIMIFYYIVCYAFVAAVMEEIEVFGFLIVHHIGFFGIIIGSILNIVAK